MLSFEIVDNRVISDTPTCFFLNDSFQSAYVTEISQLLSSQKPNLLQRAHSPSRIALSLWHLPTELLHRSEEQRSLRTSSQLSLMEPVVSSDVTLEMIRFGWQLCPSLSTHHPDSRLPFLYIEV